MPRRGTEKEPVVLVQAGQKGERRADPCDDTVELLAWTVQLWIELLSQGLNDLLLLNASIASPTEGGRVENGNDASKPLSDVLAEEAQCDERPTR